MLRSFQRSFSSSLVKKDFSKASILGRIGHVEFRESANGTPYVSYGVVVNRRPRPSNNSNSNSTGNSIDGAEGSAETSVADGEWFNINIFGDDKVRAAEKYIRKGNIVHVEATIRNKRFDGQNRLSFVQKSCDVIRWGRKPEDGEGHEEIHEEQI